MPVFSIFSRAEGQDEAAGGQRTAFIDAAGQLRQPASGGARDVELAARRSDVESGTSYAGMADTPHTANDEANRPWYTLPCFPGFSWSSVLGVLITVQLITYVVSCWGVPPRSFAEPKPMANWKLGSSNWEAERCASAVGGKYFVELRRLVVPIFLHGGILHIMLNLYFELMSGQRSLEKYGPKAFLVLFFVAGVSGNLLSDAFKTNGVGASTSCYGLLGADLAQVWLAWNLPGQDDYRVQMRGQLMQTFGMLMLWEVINWKTIDHYGHLGGLLSGLCMGVLLATEATQSPLPDDMRKRKQMCGGLLALGTAFCLYKIFVFNDLKIQEILDWEKQANQVLSLSDLCEMRIWRAYSAE